MLGTTVVVIPMFYFLTWRSLGVVVVVILVIAAVVYCCCHGLRVAESVVLQAPASHPQRSRGGGKPGAQPSLEGGFFSSFWYMSFGSRGLEFGCRH